VAVGIAIVWTNAAQSHKVGFVSKIGKAWIGKAWRSPRSQALLHELRAWWFVLPIDVPINARDVGRGVLNARTGKLRSGCRLRHHALHWRPEGQEWSEASHVPK
jgi:hypothetical protein